MKQALIIGSIIAAIILVVALSKARAKPKGVPTGKKSVDTATGTIVVTDHDATYDYKKQNGTWYTRRKGTNGQWVSLSDNMAAIHRLENHLMVKAS